MKRHLIVSILVLLLMSLIVTSCKTVAPIVTTPHNDSVVIKYEFKHDSVYLDRAHYMYLKGDTVFVHDTVTQKYFQNVFKTDTIYKDKEVVIEHPPEKYVPPFYKWCAGILISLIIVIIIYWGVRIAKAIYLRKG